MTKFLISHSNDISTVPVLLKLAGVKNFLEFSRSPVDTIWLAEITRSQHSDLILRGCRLYKSSMYLSIDHQLNVFFDQIAYKDTSLLDSFFEVD